MSSSTYPLASPSGPLKVLVLFVIATLGLGLSQGTARAQVGVTTDSVGGCTLKNHIYTCDSAAFQKALAAAKAVSVEAHNADGVARSQLAEMVTSKLGKTLAGPDNPAELVFLLVPTGEQGVVDTSPGDIDLGTLRVYSATTNGARGQLLWAETFSGKPDLPWPVVVHGLVLQFQGRFHIR